MRGRRAPPALLVSLSEAGLSGSQEAFSSAFQDASDAHVQALDVLASPFFNVNANRTELVQLAATHRLPAIYESAEYVRTGGLIAYGPVFVDMARRGATLVDKILKGADPGDIPVEITTKFALSINLKASVRRLASTCRRQSLPPPTRWSSRAVTRSSPYLRRSAPHPIEASKAVCYVRNTQTAVIHGPVGEWTSSTLAPLQAWSYGRAV